MPAAYLPSPSTLNPFDVARYYTLTQIGERVRAARVKAGDTQGDAAQRFRVTQAAISQAERAVPGMVDLLHRMAQHYLGWDFSDEEYRKVD